MKKIELYEIYMRKEYMNDFIWDRWFAWRERQAGVEVNSEQWSDLLHSMPDITDWRTNEIDQTLTIYWCENGGEQSEDVPLSEFYDDKQPDLEMLWHSNYHDGPLSGMAKYDGEYVWFDILDEDIYGTRFFGLYQLSEEDQQILFSRHELWTKYIGRHCEHHPDQYADYGTGDFEKYNEAIKTLPNVDPVKGEKVGGAYWFQFKYWVRPRRSAVDPSNELKDNKD